MTTQAPPRPDAAPEAPVHAAKTQASDAPRKRLFTREEYHAIAEAGIFAPNERVELLKGEIIAMAPPGERHSAGTKRVTHAFAGLYSDNRRTIVSVQDPVVMSPSSEPEPDLMLLAPRDDFYDFAKPRPQDVLLLIEIADSSLQYDREVKLPYYASLEIPETWIVNLQDDRVEAHTEPSPQGYRATRTYERGDSISPTAFPDVEIAVNDIIPARPQE